jgi:hypothetical protein
MIWAIALDCDGTCWAGTPPGPISRDLVERLVAAGHVVKMIGNPDRSRQSGFPVLRPDDRSKSLALRQFKESMRADRYLVVDDTPGQYPEGWPGWEFLSPQEFLRLVDGF